MSLFTLSKTIRHMLEHPLGRKNKFATISRFIRWQMSSRILGASAVMPFVGNTRLIVKRGMRGATMNLYVGLQEFEEMAFLLHMLRPEDLFIDVGANVGVYTVLAAGVSKSRVLCVEPVPETYEALIDNININRLNANVCKYNIGMAAEKGLLCFSASQGPKNHVAGPEESGFTVTVPVDTLDDLAAKQVPVLVKIDVEGFEHEVIRGGGDVLSNPSILALIVELNGLGARYGFEDQLIDVMLREKGFVPAAYLPFKRRIVELKYCNSSGNTLYVRVCEKLNKRLQEAEAVEVHGFVF